MTQRFLFVKAKGNHFTKKRSFLMGFRGFIEIHMYRLGGDPPKAIEDLAYLINKAEGVLAPKYSE